jgi:hypothetical protein
MAPSMTITPQSTAVIASDITWAMAPGPVWPDTNDALDAAVALLPDVGDDLTAGVIEAQATTIVELNERLDATFTLLSTTLTSLHESQREISRLKRRVVELLESQRTEVPR